MRSKVYVNEGLEGERNQDEIKYLKHAHEAGACNPNLSEINIIGASLKDVRQDFCMACFYLMKKSSMMAPIGSNTLRSPEKWVKAS